MTRHGQAAFGALDVSGSMAEAKLAARVFGKCPFQSVREHVLASLCQAQPSEALYCVAKRGPRGKTELSPKSYESVLAALVRVVQDGKLLVHAYDLWLACSLQYHVCSQARRILQLA